MAWFRNYYECDRCTGKWESEWSCMVDDECPFCEERDMVPFDADDLTFLIDQRPNLYVVLQSPEIAEDAPDYVEVAEFPAQAQAKSYVDEAKRRLS